MKHPSQDKPNAYPKPRSPAVRAAMEKTRRVFERLDSYSYLSADDRKDFLWFRELYLEALHTIDGRIAGGEISPLDLQDFPRSFNFPDYTIHAAIFAGSFDPFQMTHLALALRFLSCPETKASVVFIVPEGHANPSKPLKSDYDYRLELLRMQVADVFYPLIVPLDIGRGADTIGIVSRFIDLFPCGKVSITHILGSDSLPMAATLLPKDLEIWRAEAKAKNVDFSYDSFVLKRNVGEPVEPHIETLRRLGIPVCLDTRQLEAPSSTDFRKNNAFSIVFPTKAIIGHLEALFRYGLNRTWLESAKKSYDTAFNDYSSGE
jgi:hypothetical protein